MVIEKYSLSDFEKNALKNIIARVGAFKQEKTVKLEDDFDIPF